MTTTSAVALATILGFGCAVPVEEPGLEEVEQLKGVDCPEWMCGSNSSEIEHLGASDLHEYGLPNHNGFYLQSFTALVDGQAVPSGIDVDGAEIHALPIGGGPKLSGLDVRGATMRIKRTGSPTEYLVRIAEVGRIPYWAEVPRTNQQYTHTYLLEWAVLDDGHDPEFKNICVNPQNGEDTLGMDEFHAVVFEGDRIDAASKTVTGLDTYWFNIGCAGHALAKLHLTGHTYGSWIDGNFVTTQDERTTMLKMITGDYCGKGLPFTVAGVDLTWRDHKSWMKLDPGNAEVEARWTKDGASCLNKPRLAANPTKLGDQTFPDISKAIADVCKLSACPANGSEHLVSANP